MTGDAETDAVADPGFDAYLRAGIAVYNAGYYHAAHDAWEERYLDAEGEPRRFLQGLIQHTAAVHHARNRNWEGATGLAESAREYLTDVDDRGVNVAEVREWLAALERDPELVEREPPPTLRHEGRALAFADLEFEAAVVAAPLVAEELDTDVALVAQAVAYAREDLANEDVGSPFVPLVFDFLAGDDRDVVVQRLRDHAERRQAREEDVSGLFDADGSDADADGSDADADTECEDP